MNELDLLMNLRDEVPLTRASQAVENAVLAAVREPADSAASSRRLRSRRPATLAAVPLVSAVASRNHRRRLRVAMAVAAAAAVGAAGVVGFAMSAVSRHAPGPRVLPWSGRPTALSGNPGYPSLGRARTEAELVDYATRAAVISPGHAPGPHKWVFLKTESADSSAGSGGFLFGPPDKRVIGLHWVRVDWRAYASLDVSVRSSLPASKVVHGQIRISPGAGGTLAGWKSIRYSYLNSLPADPAGLESVILADNKPRMPWYARPRNVAIFDAISTLLQGQSEGVLIPPKLAASMYRVLQQLPGVHFDSGTDLAGRAGIGLYMVIDGWYKQELVINPKTYTFMGAKTVAIKAHKSVATDGTRYIKKGQVLGWQALLESAIVRHPGQMP
jgi:hypothetical protein